MAETIRKCAHPACSCPVGTDEKYCSTYCEDALKTTEISCNCGHSGCAITEGESVAAAGDVFLPEEAEA